MQAKIVTTCHDHHEEENYYVNFQNEYIRVNDINLEEILNAEID